MRDVAVCAAKRLFALDFDGVVCDSCGESSQSALKAATDLWPEVFGTEEARASRDELLSKMRAVRPVVETGYENLVQIRALLEGVTVDVMLKNWREMLPRYMEEWQLDRGDLVERFGSTRDAWMAEDLAGWLAPNNIYPGVADAVSAAMNSDEVYIVTTKQARFTQVLLSDKAGIQFPMDRIFSQTVSGRPKSEVLEKLREAHPDAECHFVEDKWSTLEKVAAMPEMEYWQLHLVDWGYNTPEERQAAEDSPRVQLVDVRAFSDLLSA